MRAAPYVLAVLGFFSALANAQDGTAARPLHLARFPKSAYQLVASKLVVEIYKKIGLVVKIESMPPKRATLEAKEGHIDGEVSRVENYFNENPELIRVNPSFTDFTMSAFSTKPISIRSKEDLAKYRIGIIRGLQASIDLTAGLANVEQASNSESLFAMLGADRFDIAIDVDVNGQFAIHNLGVSGARNVGTLVKAEAFMVLSPANARLSGKLSQAISQMRRSGELDRLKRSFEEAFVKSGVDPD